MVHGGVPGREQALGGKRWGVEGGAVVGVWMRWDGRATESGRHVSRGPKPRASHGPWKRDQNLRVSWRSAYQPVPAQHRRGSPRRLGSLVAKSHPSMTEHPACQWDHHVMADSLGVCTLPDRV